MVSRVYVEKKPGFDGEAKQLKEELRSLLGVGALENLRMVNRYDVEGISDELFAQCVPTVFSEPQSDIATLEMPEANGVAVFAVEYLPGQFDQRADSASECIQLISQGERPEVRSAKVYMLEGALSDEDVAAIKHYVINPIEAREASLDVRETLHLEQPVPGMVETVDGFLELDEAGLAAFIADRGLAMDLADIAFCQQYFAEEGRNPTITEIKMIDTYWSDHCRHTTFGTVLDNVAVEDEAVQAAFEKYLEMRHELGRDEKPVCLMDMGTIGARWLKAKGVLTGLDESEEINACTVKCKVDVDGEEQDWLYLFKNETHNHPTEIEPFGGAATCVGGAIRDPLSGRSYVYQAMRVTGAADPLVPVSETLPGKLPQRKLVTTAAAGYSSYGNQIGLATGQVNELYHPGYAAKRMEIGAVVGATPADHVRRETPAPGDVVVLLGGRTGRDGIGGATGSSKAHKLESLESCGAEVQKGNAPVERKIQRLFRRGDACKLIKRCNDFGAGGVCVAIGELAPGLEIDLNKVPKKYEGLDGTELAISESQERMAVVLDPKDVEKFRAKAQEENLDAQVVAIVTEEPRLKMEWRGDRVVDLSRAFLDTNGVTQNADAFITAPDETKNYRNAVPACLENKSLDEAFAENLSRLEVCGQKGLSERFDASIGAGTVLMPFAGKYQLTPEDAMVAKIPLLTGETDDATAMAYGYIPGIARFSPFHGAAYAVVESLSKLAAVGADPMKSRLTFQEYFERLHDKPERWGKPAAALLGALTAQLNLGLPSIGGKDSMSGSFEDLDVPPTLVSFAVTMTKASKTISGAFKNVGNYAVLLPIPEDKETELPNWEALKAYYKNVLAKIADGSVLSAHVVKEGGAAAAVAKMAFGNKLGFKFEKTAENAELLFAPKAGVLVVEVPADALESVKNTFDAVVLGTVTDTAKIELNGKALDLDDLIETWNGKLEKIFANKAETVAVEYDVPLDNHKYTGSPVIRVAKPKVFIPVFPGTNCEIDTKRAFEKAGAETEILVVQNLCAKDIEYTIDRMEKAIRSSQIIMIPGGFSGGDEPEGSGKFIATTFRNPKIAQAVTDLLDTRDGLVLGICNGFQALIKLGLVTYGKIVDLKDDDPTLTFNTLGRHVSRMVYTRVTNTKSPWLSGVNAGDVFAIPVSHGEGRFVADDAALKKLIENGQIATQYTTPCGKVSGDITWNPNGSVCGIEGITSPDGRVFGKMGHSERKGENLYFNVPGEKDQQIFESGVRYFK
ncbi:phosphoribosylformylglycinamidine synthase [Hominenteromicrobium sp.]|uniref:phosphoribosylformylglycinamidine synthase n=1 Tax=Hominenteromicrobium sp. TaxID=3073581 RepID=UPI003A9313C7